MELLRSKFWTATLVACFGASALAADPLDKANTQMKAVLDQHGLLQPKPIASLSPAEARRQPSATDAVYQLMQSKGIVAPDRLPPVGKVEMKAIPGPNNTPIPVRVYTPKGDGNIEVEFVNDMDMSGAFPKFLLNLGAPGEIHKMLTVDNPKLLRQEKYRNARLDFIDEGVTK